MDRNGMLRCTLHLKGWHCPSNALRLTTDESTAESSIGPLADFQLAVTRDAYRVWGDDGLEIGQALFGHRRPPPLQIVRPQESRFKLLTQGVIYDESQ